MEIVLTTSQMRQSDQIAIEKIGIPGLILMENAGLKSAHCILKRFGPLSGKSIGIFCGKGNNGGDGFVIGRHLSRMGARVHFFLIAKKISDVSGDAGVNMKIAQGMDLPIELLSKSTPNPELERFDLIVDALLGTGLKGSVTGPIADLIEKINQFDGQIVAVDTPSGLDCDNGRPLGSCIQADVTITMGQIKAGMMLYPGRSLVGDLYIADLNLPNSALQGIGSALYLPELGDYQRMLPVRSPESHKNKFGRILVIAGSTGLTGAAKLCSESALRSGAGMVMLGCPESLNPIFEASLTEVMTVPLPDTERGSLAKSAFEALGKWLEWSHVLALGPGLSRDPETREFVKQLIDNQSHPIVIDADGLNNLAEYPEILSEYGNEIVITPHAGEFSRLTGLSVDEISRNPLETIRKYSREWKVVILLKGATTLISGPEGDVFFNLSGNSGLASAGSGDVLTGLIAGFIGQGLTGMDAAVLGAFLHGMAADLVAVEKGRHGMTAVDVLDIIPATIKRLEDSNLSAKYSLIKHRPQRLY